MKKHIKIGTIRESEIEDKLNRPNVRLANKFSLHNEDDVYTVLLVILLFILFAFAFVSLLSLM